MNPTRGQRVKLDYMPRRRALAGGEAICDSAATSPSGAASRRQGESSEMGATSIWHWIILLLIVVLLFGRGKISEIMTDVAKGIKSFKKGMTEDEAAAAQPKPVDPRGIEHQASKPAEASPSQGTKTS
jgi:sec-independent protein translocase protein TatA